MSRLFLVRHGPTHVKAMVGWTDVKADLTDAAALARLRASLPQKALMVSSDLRRAIDTADALQLRQTRLPHAMGLREMHFGDWEMKTFNDVNATDPDGIFAFYDTPGDVAPPKGESWNMFSARVDSAIDTLRARISRQRFDHRCAFWRDIAAISEGQSHFCLSGFCSKDRQPIAHRN